MRFKGLDLNLLVAMDVLLEERSVSRAAERLHLSQPAMSAALGRLRDYFKDPILGAQGKRMVPTAHALSLRPKLKALLADVDAVVSASTLFDPATSSRRFKLGMSDYLASVACAPLVARLQAIAPGVSLDLIQPSEVMLSLLDQGELDLIFVPSENIFSDHPAEQLFEERQVVAGWAENPLFARQMSEDDFFAAGHVAVEIGRVRPQSFAESFLLTIGRERRIEIRVSSFLLAPEMLVGTTRLAVMHERLAKLYARRVPIAYVDPPFPMPAMREMIQYNRTRGDDVGLKWLIEEVREIAKHLGD